MQNCKHQYAIEVKEVITNHLGYEEIMKFYFFAKRLKYTSISLNIWAVEMFDANLSCLLLAIIGKLRHENKLYIYLEIPNHMNVLFRNGFFNYLLGKERPVYDQRESTIPLKTFTPESDDEFSLYLKRDFFAHRALDHIPFSTVKQLKTAFSEVFVNVELHANANQVYTCGQYFPNKNLLKFTLLDLGVGFLKKIKITNPDIKSDIEAIDWAVKPGNTTKNRDFGPGGYGLQDIIDYCKSNNGSIHIVSGSGYWTLSGGHHMNYRIKNPFPGAMVHLIFRKI